MKEQMTPQCETCVFLENLGGGRYFCPHPFCMYEERFRFQRDLPEEDEGDAEEGDDGE